jgi:NAD+ synthase
MSDKILKDKIVKWLREYLIKSGKNGFVVGLSGGVDSSVIALLAREAVDEINKHLLCLLLPIRNAYVDYYDEKLAKEVVEKFSLPYKIIDLTPIYNLLISNLDKARNQECYSNLKARLRMSVIYYYANMLGYLVLGTINKGEFYIGYFPKNASAGDILPIADLLKREVRIIAKAYGLPEYIVQKKASGCVWANTAEEEWGFSEDELDTMIEIYDKYKEEGLRNLSTIEHHKIEIFLNKMKESYHKREFYPIFYAK